MKLPVKIPMKMVMFGDGAHGAALQRSRNEKWGVQCDAVRFNRESAFIEEWTSDHLPSQADSTYAGLRERLQKQRVKPSVYPAKILGVSPKNSLNRGVCWHCHEREHTRDVRVKHGWRDSDLWLLPVCEPCLPAVRQNPRETHERRLRWVRKHPIKL